MAQENGRKNANAENKFLKFLPKLIAAVVVIVAVVLILTHAGRTPSEVSDSGSAEPGQTQSSDGGGENKGVPSGTNGEILTPVAKLTYPKEWTDYLQIEESESAEVYQASFWEVEDSEEKVELFTLTVGGSEGTYLLGTVPDKNGEAQNIWLDITAVKPGESWSEEKTKRVDTMQSCVNDLIDQLHQIEGFQDISEGGAK